MSGYYTYYKPDGNKIEWFDRYWKAADAIKYIYDVPEGYVFKTDVYTIINEDGTPAVQPDDEKKPFCISHVCGEIPLKYFKIDGVFMGDIEVYDRIEWFDSYEDAKNALEKHESIKIKHKGLMNDELVTYSQYFIEEPGKNKNIHDLAPYIEKEQDWRGGNYNSFDCYSKYCDKK